MPATKLSGVKYVLSQLSKVTPEARKNITKEVRSAAKPIVNKARGFVPSQSPLSGWERVSDNGWGKKSFDPVIIKRGIGFSTGSTKPNRKGFSYLAYFYNKTAAGAIYETAGRKTSGQQGKSSNPKAGQQFVSALGAVGHGEMAGRAMFRAYNEDNGKVRDAIIKTYADVIAKFNKGAL
jgi:hypothetical protein